MGGAVGAGDGGMVTGGIGTVHACASAFAHRHAQSVSHLQSDLRSSLQTPIASRFCCELCCIQSSAPPLMSHVSATQLSVGLIEQTAPADAHAGIVTSGVGAGGGGGGDVAGTHFTERSRAQTHGFSLSSMHGREQSPLTKPVRVPSTFRVQRSCTHACDISSSS